MSKETKCGEFYAIVEENKGWWKGYPYIISKEVEYSGFCNIVKGNKK